MSVIMRHPHQACRELPTSLPTHTTKVCSCCPYGYHIDLDFVRYCETLANAVPSDGQLIRRDRRRQRKSMEVMLGFEQIVQLQEIAPVIEELSPELEPSSPKWNQPNVFNETRYNTRVRSEFVRDALEDVCDDFERTLERTKVKRKDQRFHDDDDSVGDLFHDNDMTVYDNIDACIASHKQDNGTHENLSKPMSPAYQKTHKNFKTLVDLSPTLSSQKEIDRESIASNGSEVSTGALQNIREQMAISLRRMRDLEEQVKLVPLLQDEVLILKKEKEELRQKVKDEENRLLSVSPRVKITTPPLSRPFHPQRHSPISLDSLNDRLHPPISPSPPSAVNKSSNTSQLFQPSQTYIQKRDASQMTTATLTREIGITTNQSKTRTTAVNTDQKYYTKEDLQAAIDVTIEKQQLEQSQALQAKQKKLISVGTQMHPMIIPSKEMISTSQQTQFESQSIAIQTVLNHKSIAISCHPLIRSIGTSEHTIIEEVCPKCAIEKSSDGCGTDEEASLISLKLMDVTPPKRSLTFSLGDAEKLNISRKSVGTQHSAMGTMKVDSSTQHVPPPMRDKQSQHSVANTHSQQTDTKGLIVQKTQCCATEPVQLVKKSNAESNTEIKRTACVSTNTICPSKQLDSLQPVKKTNAGSNTEVKIMESVLTNTNPPLKQLDHSTNTVRIQVKDVACGIAIKPHILISCADNYCDTCKDTIMHLATGFSKSNNGSNGGVAGLPTIETSRIPRPMTLMSPRTERKFLRQNTYTVPSKDESPVEKQACPAEMYLRRSSLDSLATNKPQEPYQSTTFISDDVTPSTILPTTLPQQTDNDSNAIYMGGQTNNDEEQETILPESAPVDTLELDSNDEGLIVIKGDSKHVDDEGVRVAKQIKLVSRTKAVPNKEIMGALKVINDSLQKTNSHETNLKNANRIVQREWFRLSSTDGADPLDVEDYLDCFEEFSNNMLKYMVNLSDTNGNTAMHYSVSHANFDIVSILLDSKVCNVNQTNNAGYTCVMLVSLAKLTLSAHHTVVKRLFQMSDVNIRAKKHCQTALMLAVSHGNIDMVQMLLDAGADINIQDEDGSTALMCAAEHGRIDIVKLLLAQSDCDSTIQDIDGSTALKISLEAGYRDIGVLLYAHEHITRGKTSPYTSLRRKKKQSSLSRPTSVSTPASPATSTKFQHQTSDLKTLTKRP